MYKIIMNKSDHIGNKDLSDDVELIDASILAEFDTSGFKDASTSKAQNTNVNKSANLDTSELNVSALCCDEELNGYDKLSGKKWFYPINYPVRDYQFNIIQAAIEKNTLVSLPTGLGKTFIAAVLMYNFYRWYPLGKIIFTAPTRPLIAQQIEACYKIIAMPPDDTIEMTGGMSTTLRQENWKTKRVFFVTPQVVYNDIKSGICPRNKIRCLVIDEAHKAKSNYAYCQIVSILTELGHRTYRILALSATPGSRINDVVQVVQNLHIAHLELRTENCIDVAPYCHSRNIKTVIIPLGPELTKLRNTYIEIMDYYARRLKQMNILKSNLGNLSKGRILMIYRDYQNNKERHPQRSYILKDLSQLISLYHGLELLVKHGARAFLNFFDEHTEKMWIQSDDRLTVMLERLREDLGTNPLSLDLSERRTSIPESLNFGHPKFDKVKEILENHFKTTERQDTRAIVFCEYHETVKLVYCMLKLSGPPINPLKFVGQGAGKEGRSPMSQEQQLRAMAAFRAGRCNVLVATCVAEEGLDVGSVDLILCFDVATRSPVRLVQRCGRTGRERSGKVYFLVTEGKEHQTLMDGMQQRDSLKTKILHSKEVQESLYKLNPRMIPYDFKPRCEKIYVKVRPLQAKGGKKSFGGNQQMKSKKNQKKRETVHTVETTSNVNINVNENLPTNTDDNITNILSSLKQADTATTNSPKKSQNGISSLTSSFLSSQKDGKKAPIVPALPSSMHSDKSPLKKTQKEKSKIPFKSSKKNADIRALFLAANKPHQTRAKIINELCSQDTEIPTQVLDLLIDLKITCDIPKICYICQHICDCQKITELRKTKRERPTPFLQLDAVAAFPDLELINNFSAESILKCVKKTKEVVVVNTVDIDNSDAVDELQITLPHNFNIGDAEDIFALTPPENKCTEVKDGEHHEIILPISSSNFDLGSVDDILVLSDENEKLVNDIDQQNKTEDKIKEIECSDIIDLSFDISPEPKNRNEPPQTTISPSVLSGSHKSFSKSPILRTQKRSLQLKRRESQPSSRYSIGNAKKKLDLGSNTLSNSMLSITQLIDQINTSDCSSPNAGDSSTLQTENERRRSPILLTQADRKKKICETNTNESILTNRESLHIRIHNDKSPTPSTLVAHKRKIDDNSLPTSCFNKKQKVDDQSQRSAETIQDKIFAALTSNKVNISMRSPKNLLDFNNRTQLKLSPEVIIEENHEAKENKHSPFNLNIFSYTPKTSQTNSKRMPTTLHSDGIITLNGHKPKKKKPKNDFICLEAELSGDELGESGDELSDDSVGSLAEFVTDKDVTHTEEDMVAHYLKSVKSPLKIGAFKIPQLKTMAKSNIYSQFVEPDSYELDSFCVDSHVELTQSRDLSNLEIAELVLEEERRQKKISQGKSQKASTQENGDSPVIKRKNGKKYYVISDSDDSS